MIRVLVPVPDPHPERLEVAGERFHYLAHVLRVREGQAVEVFDGRGRAFRARVESVAAEALTLLLEQARATQAQRPVTIVQGLPKGDKLEWIIEKGTELGAAAFVPVSTAHAVVRLDDARAERKRERWQKIAEEAARQCGRSDVPAVLGVRPLKAVREALPPDARVLVLDEAERARRLSEALPPADVPLALVVGPEGGLAREEVHALEALGAVPVTLGTNILRTETAALAALAVVRHRDGHLG